MGASLSARLIRTATGWYVKNINAQKADIAKMRARWAIGSKFLLPAFGVKRSSTKLAGVDVEILTPSSARDGKVLLYLHGGAFVMGNPATHRQLISHLARAGDVRAVVPDYRLAPEHKFPAGLEDCLAVYDALLANGVAAENIVIAGDSAGGNLAVAALLSLRDAGKPRPAAAVLLSPIIDFTGSGESARTRAASDPWFRPENIQIVAEHYCAAAEITNPLVSPLFGNFDDIAPLYIQVGDREILLSDSVRLADLQRAAGGEVLLEVWPEMWHVFQFCTLKTPESRRAIQKIGEYLRQRLS